MPANYNNERDSRRWNEWCEPHHDATKTVDPSPSQPTLKVDESSQYPRYDKQNDDHIFEVQVANRSSSIMIQTREIVQMLDETIFKGVHENTNDLSDISFMIPTKLSSIATPTIHFV